MTTLQERVQKADLVIANLNANGGVLNPEQSDRFIQLIIDEPTLINQARTVTMTRPEQEFNKIGFGSRILRPAVENTALSAGDRSSPDTNKVVLTNREIMAEVRIPYGVLEDNIEKDNMTDTILSLIAKRAALDLEELFILGDTASSDPYLALMDGCLKRMVSHTANVTGLGYGSKPFNSALLTMPKKYRRNKNLLKFFVPTDAEQNWRETVAERQTILGDTTIAGQNLLNYVHGVEMKPVALLPETTGLLLDPKNLIIGFQRDFRLESMKLIASRQWQFVLTARVGFQIELEDATVTIENLGA